jgi:hypothetical protein
MIGLVERIAIGQVFLETTRPENPQDTLMTFQGWHQGRPRLPLAMRFSSGINGSITAHCSSVRSICSPLSGSE